MCANGVLMVGAGLRIGPRPTLPGGTEGDARVLRGGSWAFPAGLARSACRSAYPRGDFWHGLGFRFALRSPSPAGGAGGQ